MESSEYSISWWKLSRTFFNSRNRWSPICRCFSSSFILASHSCNHIHNCSIPQACFNLLTKHFEIILSANSFLIALHEPWLNLSLNTNSFLWLNFYNLTFYEHFKLLPFVRTISRQSFYDREIFVDKENMHKTNSPLFLSSPSRTILYSQYFHGCHSSHYVFHSFLRLSFHGWDKNQLSRFFLSSLTRESPGVSWRLNTFCGCLYF